MPTDAPTPRQALDDGLHASINCIRCRVLRVPQNLLERLIASGRGDIPMDQIVFRCEVCGEIGTPWISGPGNLTIGRKQYWPPV